MLDIVIPLYYNSPALYLPISRCLQALKESNEPFSIIMVDDASPLDHNFMEEYWITYFRNTYNEGFTKTVNRGLRQARGDVIVVMNDDIVVTDQCLSRFQTLTGLTIASPLDTAASVDDRFGACFAMTREVYELLGPLDERYRNFYSDLDYYTRAKAAGVNIIKYTDVVLEHPESSTYKTLDKDSLLEVDRKAWENRNV